MSAEGVVDPCGRFEAATVSTKNGFDVTGYTWLPDCGVDGAKGTVFIMHGIFCHVRFEFLEPDDGNFRNVYKGSLVEKLNDIGFIVVGHDHPAHGKSSGLRGYVESFSVLRDAAIDFFDQTLARTDLKLAGKKSFLAAMSMGGTTAVEVARERPELFDGYLLFSPAVRPPDDMFGPVGMFLKSISGVLNIIAPRWRAMSLPPSDIDEIRDAVEKDDLVQKEGLRVRLGVEFLRTYADIERNVESIRFPALLAFVGAHDNIVSPSGMKAFVDRVKSTDKEMVAMDNMRHEVLREPGREKTFDKVISWISERS